METITQQSLIELGFEEDKEFNVSTMKDYIFTAPETGHIFRVRTSNHRVILKVIDVFVSYPATDMIPESCLLATGVKTLEDLKTLIRLFS